MASTVAESFAAAETLNGDVTVAALAGSQTVTERSGAVELGVQLAVLVEPVPLSATV